MKMKKHPKPVEIQFMPPGYTDNYEIIWLAETYCRRNKSVGVLAIVRDVCKVFNLREHQIYGYAKQNEITIPRAIAMYAAREVTGFDYVKLGRLFQRDHTSILYAARRVKNFLYIKDQMFMNYWNRYISDSEIYPLNKSLNQCVVDNFGSLENTI